MKEEDISQKQFPVILTGDEIDQVLKAVGTATALWAKNRRHCPASVDTTVLIRACDKIAHSTDPGIKIRKTSELPKIIPPLPEGDTKDLKVWHEYWEKHDTSLKLSVREEILKELKEKALLTILLDSSEYTHPNSDDEKLQNQRLFKLQVIGSDETNIYVLFEDEYNRLEAAIKKWVHKTFKRVNHESGIQTESLVPR